MTSIRRLFALAAVSGLLLLLPNCRRQQPTGQEGPFYIMLTYNNGNCQQNGSNGVIDVPSNQSVIYQGATALSQFNIQFSGGSCPFASGVCPVNSPNGNPVNVGQPNGNAVGNTYMYSSMTMNGQNCTDVGPMGMRVKGGP